MYAHAGAKHNFARNIWRFWHLHHLAKYQLLNHFRGNIATSQHFADNHFSQINGGNTVKYRGLTGKRRT